MSENLKTNLDIQLLNDDTNTIVRFFNDVSTIPLSDYRYGKMSIASGTVNTLLSSNFHYVFFNAELPIEYKIGDGGMTRNARTFLHCGDAIDLYISNENTGTIELEYVCAKIE